MALLAIGYSAAGTDEPLLSSSDAVVFMYHRFSDDRYPSTNTSLSDFKRHIETIRAEGWTIVALTEILDPTSNQNEHGSRNAAITIDDAYLSVYEEAWPYLRDNKIPFTLFVATEPLAIGQRDYMTPEQLREIASYPSAIIANHGHTHNGLAFASKDIVFNEIETASNLLSEWLESDPPPIFAFPYGEASATVLNTLEELGFMVAFGQHSGALGPYQHRLYLPRFPMSGNFASLDRLREALSSKPLPHSNFTPINPAITQDDLPATIEFSLLEGLTAERLNCFADGVRLQIKSTGNRVEIKTPPKPKPPRWRVNCTHPAPDRRWYWLGWQAAIESTSRE